MNTPRLGAGRWPLWLWTVAAALAGVVVAVAYVRWLDTLDPDFITIWHSGRVFWSDASLYARYEGVKNFLYPPFAALVFSPLSALPYEVAVGVFAFVNVAVYPATVSLTWNILEPTTRVPAPALVMSLGVGALLSARYFLNNLALLNVNALLFLLCLWGIRAFLQRRQVAAAAALTVATMIKVAPVFFLLWMALRGRNAGRVTMLVTALGCVLLPWVARGPTQGARDLREFVALRVEPAAAGETTRSGVGNQSLLLMIKRMTLPSRDVYGDDWPLELVERKQHWDAPPSYRYLPASARTALIAYRIVAVSILLVYLTHLWRLRRRRAPISAWEIALAFVMPLLLSSVTWKAHLVVLLFVYAALFACEPRSLPRWMRATLWSTYAASGVLGLAAKPLLGERLFYDLLGYSVYAWLLLVVFALLVMLSESMPRRAPA